MTTSIVNPTLASGPTGSSPPTELLASYVRSVAVEGDRFAAVAAAGDLDTAIPACPGWDLRELVRHVGLVHLWAAANIRFPSDRWLKVDGMSDLADYWPEQTARWPSDAALVTWYRSTLWVLLDVLETTPPDHRCLTFLPAPSPLVMWARRQASELAVHRFDAEAACGLRSDFDAVFAADMLDELLVGFAPKMRTVADTPSQVLQVVPDDIGAQFAVTLDESGVRTSRQPGPADLRISGTAADLYVLLWNRPAGPSIEMAGDPEVLRSWTRSCRVRWR